MSSPSTLRRLWQPPGRFEDRPSDRRVTFLELFVDLVFVVVISQLAHRLAEHVSCRGSNGSSSSSMRPGLPGSTDWYHDLHGTNDVSVRVFTFAQMLAVAVMAAFIGDVPGRGSFGFALGYAAALD